MVGKKVLVTAGPTRESLDPVRYITNHSTGKMGYAIAENAARRGAEVTLVSGPTQLKRPRFMKVIDVTTAEEMFQAVNDAFDTQDIILMAAAVADYRPTTVADHKIKKSDGEMNIPLERTTDIIGTLTQRKKQQFICGFSMETQNMLENSRAKLAKKNLDMIVANNLKVAGAGFGTDTNIVTVITKDACEELPIMKKEEVAGALFDRILSQL